MASSKRTRVAYKSSLFFSEWFLPLVTSYLNFPTIKSLDSVMCESQLRGHWLHCLSKEMKSIQLELEHNYCFDDIEYMIDWLVMRQVDLHEFAIIAADEVWFTMTSYTLKKLLQNNPNFKKLCFTGFLYMPTAFKSFNDMNDKCLPNISDKVAFLNVNIYC